MRNVKQGKLPKPATDPVQVALAAIKQLPQETEELDIPEAGC